MVVDALRVGGEIGRIYRLKPEEMSDPETEFSLHNFGVNHLLKVLPTYLGEAAVPRIVVIGAEVSENFCVSNVLTPTLAASVNESYHPGHSRMHELSLIGSVLKLVEKQSVAEHFQHVISVRLGVGELSNVETDALVFCFCIAKRGSLADDATLAVETIPGRAWCDQCKETVHIASRADPCPSCKAWGLSVTGGDQVAVLELEVE